MDLFACLNVESYFDRKVGIRMCGGSGICHILVQNWSKPSHKKVNHKIVPHVQG